MNDERGSKTVRIAMTLIAHRSYRHELIMATKDHTPALATMLIAHRSSLIARTGTN